MTLEAPLQSSEEFHKALHEHNIYGLWELASQMTPHPLPKAVPHMWKWSLLDEMVKSACEVVPIGEERRAMQLFNPGLDGRWATTNTLIGAIQVILPGEVARAHRHTPTAIRFIIEGSSAYTAVDGERVYMEPGDLVLTPSWSWHDHGNEGDKPVVWLDGLDIPLVQSMDSMFFQMYDVPQVPLTQENGRSMRLHGQPGLSPTWVKEKPASSPLLLYSWEHTRQALEDLRGDAGDPYDGIALEYTHPMTGGPVLPTMACNIQLIRPYERLQPHRHTGSAVYYVAQGQGETVIEGETYAWGKGDVIAQPSWALHAHANTSATEDAILFSISDRPVLEALNLYREATE